MPCMIGTRYTRNFAFKYCASGFPIDITGWKFRSMIRDSRDDPYPLAELTTENGGFIVIDGILGRLQFSVSPTQSSVFPVGRVMMDVERTDLIVTEGPIWLFEASFQVKRPITRDI